jgi:hypothetical protein
VFEDMHNKVLGESQIHKYWISSFFFFHYTLTPTRQTLESDHKGPAQESLS